MKVRLSNYRQAPRKVRLIADVVRGKDVSDALTVLTHMKKRAALPFAKLIQGAVSNAKEQGEREENLMIKSVQVDKGYTFKRYRPRARGRASRIDKHTSNIKLELQVKPEAKPKTEKKTKPKAEKKEKAKTKSK